MASSVRLSPFGIFVSIAVGFVFLYAARHVIFAREPSCIDSRYVGETVPVKRLLEISIYLAEKGGVILKEIREQDGLKEQSKGLTAEGVVDPLTEGDLQSHRAIVQGFHHFFPLVRVVSEEHDANDNAVDSYCVKSDLQKIKSISNDLHGNSEVYIPSDDILIWVDPLDATKEYTEKLLNYVTTMVCIAVNGVPIAGVIHQPFLQHTVWAWAGHGHSKQLLKPSEKKASLKNPRIIVSRSHAGSTINQTSLAFGDGVKIIPAGGAGFKVLSLFNSQADAYIHKTLIKKWDICAGDALLRSSGGKMTTLDGQEISYGDKTSVKNHGGLLATLHNHKHFLNKLSSLTQDTS